MNEYKSDFAKMAPTDNLALEGEKVNRTDWRMKVRFIRRAQHVYNTAWD